MAVPKAQARRAPRARIRRGARRPNRPRNPPRPAGPSRRGRAAAPESASAAAAKAAAAGAGPLGRVAYWGAVAGLWLVIAAIGGAVWVGAHLPPIQSLEIPKRPPSIKIVDLQGQPLATRGDMGGAAVPLKDLPRYVPQAFVAIEDRRFYSHYGIDPIGIARAVVANILRRGVSQGGSTLTQQLAKNLFLTQERTLSRKVQELALALWLERKFSKTQILDLYLNRVYFGAGAYGIEAAAQRYFGKPAHQAHGGGGGDARGPRPLAVAAGAEPQSGRRREARPGRARRHDGHEVHHRRHGQGRADAAGACDQGRRARARSATSPTG